jgi:hypothetical protein
VRQDAPGAGEDARGALVGSAVETSCAAARTFRKLAGGEYSIDVSHDITPEPGLRVIDRPPAQHQFDDVTDDPSSCHHQPTFVVLYCWYQYMYPSDNHSRLDTNMTSQHYKKKYTTSPPIREE